MMATSGHFRAIEHGFDTVPAGGLLECGAGVKQGTFGPGPADQLQAHGKAVGRESHRQREFAEAIEIPASAEQLVLSGVGPTVSNASAPPDTAASYGDTATQTRNVLGQIEHILRARGYQMGDIVSMRALIVADPATGKPDFTGFSGVYNQYFGTGTQPNVPVRTRARQGRRRGRLRSFAIFPIFCQLAA
ncbi:Rid family hydrolase [Cupriavidus basilensis]|uniref:TdcF protein n=1 Tax=Cupriavidus basilensis TaxID=68895 RepID=A0A0C4YVQ7_9BURK|nr:TdcF protein [Cupriavidus basilensis]